MISTSSIPNIIADTLLAIRRSMTANVASISIEIIDPSTVGTRLSLRLGTACKHSLDTSEKDPIIFNVMFSNFLETRSRKPGSMCNGCVCVSPPIISSEHTCGKCS